MLAQITRVSLLRLWLLGEFILTKLTKLEVDMD